LTSYINKVADNSSVVILIRSSPQIKAQMNRALRVLDKVKDNLSPAFKALTDP
jgi:prefoldin subunit 5